MSSTKYERPTVTTYSASEIVAWMGPAQASSYGGGGGSGADGPGGFSPGGGGGGFGPRR